MERRLIVIFVSRRNSLRSVLAEACLGHVDTKQRFTVHACGQPGQVDAQFHPAAVAALDGAGIPVPQRPPRSWDELVRSGIASSDFVITLDKSIQQLEPRWPGQPDAAVWDFPDVAAQADAAIARAAAVQTLFLLKRRLELLINLPMQGVDRSALRSDLRDMAYMR